MILAKDVLECVASGSIDEGADDRAVLPRRNMVRLQEHRTARVRTLIARLAGVGRRLQGPLTWPLKFPLPIDLATARQATPITPFSTSPPARARDHRDYIFRTPSAPT